MSLVWPATGLARAHLPARWLAELVAAGEEVLRPGDGDRGGDREVEAVGEGLPRVLRGDPRLVAEPGGLGDGELHLDLEGVSAERLSARNRHHEPAPPVGLDARLARGGGERYHSAATLDGLPAPKFPTPYLKQNLKKSSLAVLGPKA